MTDKDIKSNAPSAAGSSVVMVDKSSASRHKPFRPTDLQDDGPVEQHHKRSRAPAVPSMTEKSKHVSSKISTKRASSPEAISMATIEMDVQRADIVPTPTQPIPATVGPASVTGIKDLTERDDSITGEGTEMRTSDSPHREWDSENRIQECVPHNPEAEDTVPLQRKIASETISKTIKEKKEISWTQSAYLDKVHSQNFNSRSVSWMLDRKASVGPCFKKTLPHGEPCGITICLPKGSTLTFKVEATIKYTVRSCIVNYLNDKSSKMLNENINTKQTKSGGINITVSKRCLDNNTKFSSDFEIWNRADRVVIPRKENKKIEINNDEGKGVNLFENLKGKLNNWRGKIKHALHI